MSRQSICGCHSINQFMMVGCIITVSTRSSSMHRSSKVVKWSLVRYRWVRNGGKGTTKRLKTVVRIVVCVYDDDDAEFWTSIAGLLGPGCTRLNGDLG